MVRGVAEHDHFLAIWRHLPVVDDSDETAIARVVVADVMLENGASI